MLLRTKLLVFMLVVGLLSAGSHYLNFQFGTFQKVDEFEKNNALKAAKGCLVALNGDLEKMRRLADLIAEYKGSSSDKEPEILSKQEVLGAMGLDFFQIGSEFGEVQQTVVKDLNQEKKKQIEELAAMFSAVAKPSKTMAGYFKDRDSVLLLARAPIHRHGPLQTNSGNVLIASFVKAKYLNTLGNHLNAAIELVDGAKVPNLDSAEKSNGMVLIEQSKSVFLIYAPLDAFTENSKLYLKLEYPRLLSLMSWDSYRNTIELALVNVIFTLAIVFILLRKFFTNPLRRLADHISTQRTEALFEDFGSNRKDEFGILASEFNLMMVSLKGRSKESGLISDLDNLLAASEATEEALQVFGRIASRLFPDESGALSLQGESLDFLETVVSWGDCQCNKTFFSSGDCWSLRRGRPHHYSEDGSSPPCNHLTKSKLKFALCVPLTAQGETLGVIHLFSDNENLHLKSKVRLAKSLSEHTSLALANLRLREALKEQAIRDPLTGLFNRRYLDVYLDKEISRARRAQIPVSLMMMDLDHFKRFNDEFGHEAGDYVLKKLGSILLRNVRNEDVACRYGGEEFTLILPGASLEIAKERADDLCEQIRTLQLRYEGDSLGKTTISIGVAAFPDHGEKVDELLSTADKALYLAKSSGRDRAVVSS